MPEQFQITLINDKIKLYQRFGWFLIIVFFAVASYFYFFVNSTNDYTGGIIFLASIALLLTLKFAVKKTKQIIDIRYFFALAILALFINQQYLFASLALVLMFLFTISTLPKILTVNIDGIQYPSFPIRKIHWQELNTALIKDGLLTIDFKSDKIIQQFIVEAKTNVSEQEFNDFCNKYISK